MNINKLIVAHNLKSSAILYNHPHRKVVCATGSLSLCTLESAKYASIETTPTSNRRGYVTASRTVARYCSIVLLLHHQRLAQTGSSDRQVNDARACRLAISCRNVIAPGMQAQNTQHTFTPASDRTTTIRYSAVCVTGLPTNIVNSSAWTVDKTQCPSKNYSLQWRSSTPPCTQCSV